MRKRISSKARHALAILTLTTAVAGGTTALAGPAFAESPGSWSSSSAYYTDYSNPYTWLCR